MVLAQDQAQRNESLAPQERRAAKAKYESDLKQYEIDLAKHNKDTADYEIALKAYENQVAKNAAEQKAFDDKIKAEADKIAADQKRLDDLGAAHGAEIQKLLNDKQSAMDAVDRNWTQSKIVGSGGGFPQGDGTDKTIYWQERKPQSVLENETNAVGRQYNVLIESEQRSNSVEYQQVAFGIDYPNAGALGGSWYRSWQKNPNGGTSLSGAFEAELKRQETQRNESNRLSIAKAYAERDKAAKAYSVDPVNFSKSIQNFGPTELRAFSQKEIDRRAAIKPAAIPKFNIDQPSLPQRISTQGNIPNKPVPVERLFAGALPTALTAVDATAISQRTGGLKKSTTKPTATILSGVVLEKTGAAPVEKLFAGALPTASAEAIAVSQRTGGLKKSTNRPTAINVKFSYPTIKEPPPPTAQEKQEIAIGDFYNSFKSTTKPTATILSGVVLEKTGTAPTLKTQAMINDLTANMGSPSYTRSAVINYKEDGVKKSFNTEKGIGDIKFAKGLGYKEDDVQEISVNNFYNSYKSLEKPSGTILSGVVLEKTGTMPTIKTQGMINDLTANQGSPSYTRSAIYSFTDATGKKSSFDAKTGTGDYKIAKSLGYEDQSVQGPPAPSNNSGVTMRIGVTPAPKPKSLYNQGIESALTYLDPKQTSQYDPEKPETSLPVQIPIGLAVATGTTIAYASNLWESKVKTFNLRGEPTLKNNILAPKIEYTNPATGGYSGYAFLGSIANSLKSSLENQGGRIQFEEPRTGQIKTPESTFAGEVMTLDANNVINFVKEKGVGATIGQGLELAIGAGKLSGAAKVTGKDIVFGANKGINEVKGTGDLILSGRTGNFDPNYLRNYYKLKTTSSGFVNEGFGVVEKKSLWETIKTPFVKKGNIPDWVIDDVMAKQAAWRKMNVLEQSTVLKNEAKHADWLHNYDRSTRYLYNSQGRRYTTIDQASNFVGKSVPMGASLAGVIAKAEGTKPRPLSTLYDDLPYTPSKRSNEIDFDDAGTHKPSFDYTPATSAAPSPPRSIEPKPSDKPASVFGGTTSSAPTKRFKSDSEIEKDVKASGGTIDKNGVVTITKQESKTITKQESKSIQQTKQIQSSRLEPFKVKTQTGTRLKTKLKSKQIYGAVSIQGYSQKQSSLLATIQKQKQKQKQQTKQATKQVQAYKYKLDQPQMYKQQTKQATKQVQAYKYKFAQPQMYKQQTKQATKQIQLFKQKLKAPQKLKLKTPLRMKPIKVPFRFKTRPPPDKNITRKVPPLIFDEKKRSKKSSSGKQKTKLFIGNVSEIQVEGIYNRANITRGAKKVKQLKDRDFKGIGKIRKASDKVRIF